MALREMKRNCCQDFPRFDFPIRCFPVEFAAKTYTKPLCLLLESNGRITGVLFCGIGLQNPLRPGRPRVVRHSWPGVDFEDISAPVFDRCGGGGCWLR